jgi:hypothetical protein
MLDHTATPCDTARDERAVLVAHVMCSSPLQESLQGRTFNVQPANVQQRPNADIHFK